ncbi:hypothetical protein FPV67DRAFT_1671500 [Lyophyllum atratum]|nr:hypothetical protein FPV67DRAFT_1671500 [Lyophyllum atratum]
MANARGARAVLVTDFLFESLKSETWPLRVRWLPYTVASTSLTAHPNGQSALSQQKVIKVRLRVPALYMQNDFVSLPFTAVYCGLLVHPFSSSAGQDRSRLITSTRFVTMRIPPSEYLRDFLAKRPNYQAWSRHADPKKIIEYEADYEDYTKPRRALGPFDALAIADHGERVDPENPSRWALTSPNVEWVPRVLRDVAVISRKADGRFGYHDRSNWPQICCEGWEWMACIPRRPKDPNDPLSVLWWTPALEDFVPVDDTGIDLGHLRPEKITPLANWMSHLQTETHEYLLTHSDLRMAALRTATCHAFARINVCPMTRRDTIEYVAEFEGLALDLLASLDMARIYWPRLTWTEEACRAVPVAHHLMGVVTEQPEVVQKMFTMGLPVYFLRASNTLDEDMSIRNVDYPCTSRDVVTEPYQPNPFPVLGRIGPGVARQQMMQRLGCQYIMGQAAGNAGHVTSLAGTTSHLGTLTGPLKVSGAYMPDAVSPSYIKLRLGSFEVPTASNSTGPGPMALPAPSQASSLTGSGSREYQGGRDGRRGRGAGYRGRGHIAGPYAQAHGGRTPTPGNVKEERDKFLEVAWEWMPRPIIGWSQGLAHISPIAKAWRVSQAANRSDTNRPRYDRMALGYALPDPGMIASSAALRTKYTVTYLARRGPILWREGQNGFHTEKRASPQDWRNLLGEHLPDATTQSSTHRAGRRRERAAQFFQEAGLQLRGMPSTVTWRGRTYSSTGDDLTPAVVNSVLWDLFEHNFRLEVLALEREVMSADWQTSTFPTERDCLVRDVFFDLEGGVPGGSYLIGSAPEHDMGLAASEWRTRQRFIKNLHTLLATWPPRPAVGRLPVMIDNPDEATFTAQEREVATYYCWYFFDVFRRAPCTPHSIHPVGSL